MRPRRSANLVALIGAALTASALAAPATDAPADQTLTPVPERPPAPDFNLKDPAGQPANFSDFKGKPVILNFWATWCPPCREEMPSMERAHQVVSKEGIALVAINVGEDADTIEQFLSNYPVSFPLPMDQDSKVVQSYPVRGLPTTFVIDAEGRLAFVATGGREWDDPKLLDQVRALRR